MTLDMQTSPEPGSKLTIVGGFFTLSYLAILAFVAWKNWAAIENLKPNEWGDMLGGSFAPLAFLWLVLGFFQQGHELRQNVIALRLQGEELRNSVEQQRALVEATRDQIEFEKAVLERERIEQDRRRRPQFRAGSNGGFYSDKVVQRDIVVENFGATCTNIRLEIQSAGARVNAVHQAELAKGGAIGIRFEVLREEDINGYALICRYVDQSNEEGERRFLIENSAQEGDFFCFKVVPEEA